MKLTIMRNTIRTIILNSIQFFDNTNVKLEETNVDRINVSPNPATNKVTVSSNDLIIENLSLFNQQGQLLKEAYHTSEMDISNFSPGIYFLQIKIQDGVVTKKIIKI